MRRGNDQRVKDRMGRSCAVANRLAVRSRWDAAMTARMGLFLGGAAAAPVFGQGAANALTGLASPYGELAPTFWERNWIFILAGILVLLAAGGVTIWKLLHPRPRPAVPAQVVALEALEKWRGQPEDVTAVSEISLILRRYVATAFGLEADRRTTREFAAGLAGNEEIGPELALRLTTFFQECDRRKFSAEAGSEPLNAAERAGELVEKLEERRVPFGVQG